MYDLIIIGASASGIPAAVYAARRKLNFKVISDDFGGEMARSGEIENWPATIHTTGVDLADKFREQAKANNVRVEEGIKITKIEKEGNTFKVIGAKNGTTTEDSAKTVIIATGVHPRELSIPGEKELRNKGVSYCTVCDGPLFKDKIVATIGGGNSALESAIMLSEIASKVYIINKNDSFKGDSVLIDKVTKSLSTKNVEVIYGAMTQKILGDSFVSNLEYKLGTGETKTIEVSGIFVHIGMIPNSGFVPEEIQKNKFGEIEVNMRGETNIPGLFAAGDVTTVPYKQLAISAGQGVTALLSAVDYLNKLPH